MMKNKLITFSAVVIVAFALWGLFHLANQKSMDNTAVTMEVKVNHFELLEKGSVLFVIEGDEETPLQLFEEGEEYTFLEAGIYARPLHFFEEDGNYTFSEPGMYSVWKPLDLKRRVVEYEITYYIVQP